MKFSFFAISCLFFFGACNNEWNRYHLENISPVSGAESFSAILSVDTLIDNKEFYFYYEVLIDTNGNLQRIAKADSNISFFWNSKKISDSIILFSSRDDTTINSYNINSRRRKVLLHISGFFEVSNDKNHLATGKRIYKLLPDSLILEGETSQYEGFSPFGENMFRARKIGTPMKMTIYILNPDFSVFDSIPESRFTIGQKAIRNRNGEEILLSSAMAITNYLNVAARYNIVTKTLDTLFQGDWYFSNVLPLQQPNFYLVQGLTRNELEEASKHQAQEKKEWKKKNPHGYIDFAWPRGYWMIGNSATKKLSKIGFEDYFPTLSSSGRHILFYKRKSDDYEIKVVSVKEVVEGM